MKVFRLTKQEKHDISKAVHDAEMRTSGEILPVLVRASDDYSGARWRVAVGFSLLVSGSIAWFSEVSALAILLAQLPLLMTGHVLSSWEPLLRLSMAPHEMELEVKQRALQAFIRHGLHRTAERSGVLLFVSMLERRIEILADTGVDQKVPAGTWDGVIQKLVQAIHDGKVGEGMTVAISEIGSRLSEVFPQKGSHPSRLPNRVLIEE